MAGQTVQVRGLTFEVFTKSLRLVRPYTSPFISFYTDLNIEDNRERAINDFIEVMNIGIRIYKEKEL